jgi:ribonucleoside-triphosphate reductase
VKSVLKRNGEIVPFNIKKISDAIQKALDSTGESSDKGISTEIASKVESNLDERFPKGTATVEQIQDLVEKSLMINGYHRTAKAYIVYRKQHEDLRNFASLMSNFQIIDKYLDESDWRVKENSNMTYSLQGLNFHISSSIISSYWLNKLYPEEIGKPHLNGDYHIHDLGVLGPYCVGWDLKDLLLKGFCGVPGKIQSKPPTHFRAALGQIVNFFYTMQGEAAGAQAFSNFDTLLAPFIAYDKLTYKDVVQAMQEFLFNINVPTRVGFQTPFTNITLDLAVPDYMKDEKVIIGGREQDKAYKEFRKEMDMLNKAFAELMLKGDAKGRPFSFPIPTYNITEDFDWDSPLLESVWEMTAKYGIPYFANYVNSDMKPEDARSMCCRLRLDNRELKKRGGGLFGANPLTGSIGVVTINLPRIGYLSENEDKFLSKLGELMDMAKKSLETKRKVLENFTETGLYPYSRFYLSGNKKAQGAYWKNHFSTIGLLGMNEASINLTGKNIGEPDGQKFAIRVLEFMREKLGNYQEETGNLYNLEATPAEGTSYRLARADKARFPGIIVANEEEWKNRNAEPFYTNSSQLPVNYTDDLFELLDKQDKIQTLYTGGTVVHLFLGERLPDTESTKRLVKKIAGKYNLPYYTITPTFSICPIHGYINGEHEFCPFCEEIEDEESEAGDGGYVEVKL